MTRRHLSTSADSTEAEASYFRALKIVERRIKAGAAPLKSIGAATQRVIATAAEILLPGTQPPISYQHSVLCQTCLPYRNPGDGVRRWERDNGAAALLLTAGEARHPSGKWVEIGLPYGPKPRQILAYLNTQAILQQQPVIDIERSLASFIDVMGYADKGQSFRVIKDQITRLAACDFRLGFSRDGLSAETHKGTIVASFNLWLEKDERQRVLWPRAIALDPRYFTSLIEHAVPLDTRAVAALGHSAMALDIYAWLAQRLHRIAPGSPVTIGWPTLQRQFGEGFSRLRKFREKFLIALKAAKAVYPAARLSVDGRGLTLEASPPPIAKRLITVAALDNPAKT